MATVLKNDPAIKEVESPGGIKFGRRSEKVLVISADEQAGEDAHRTILEVKRMFGKAHVSRPEVNNGTTELIFHLAG